MFPSITSPNIPTATSQVLLDLTSALCVQSQQHGPVTHLRVSRPDAQLVQRGRGRRWRRRRQSLFPRVILSSAQGRDSRAEPGRNATQEISCQSSLYYHIFNSLTLFFFLCSRFGTNSRSRWLRGDGLLYFCGAFWLASRGSGHREESG